LKTSQPSAFGGNQNGGLFSGGNGTGGIFGKNEKKDSDSSPSSGFSLFGAGQKSPVLPEVKADQGSKVGESLVANQANGNSMFKAM